MEEKPLHVQVWEALTGQVAELREKCIDSLPVPVWCAPDGVAVPRYDTDREAQLGLQLVVARHPRCEEVRIGWCDDQGGPAHWLIQVFMCYGSGNIDEAWADGETFGAALCQAALRFYGALAEEQQHG